MHDPGAVIAMERFLKDWRQDAMNKHQLDTAIFIGDKLLALTSMAIIALSLAFQTNIC